MSIKKVKYNSEEEFLKSYNPNDYDRISVTADLLVLSISSGEKENYRKLNNKHFSILLVKRTEYPFKDRWCLPGGFIHIDETIGDAAKRILKNETNLSDIYIEQLYTFSGVDRDPRMRVISTSYISLIDKSLLNIKLNENASWFDMNYTETKEKFDFFLTNGVENIEFEVKKTLKDKTTDRYSFTTTKNDKLAFDHPLVIASGISRIKNKLSYTDIVFNMMPEYFTLGELQQVYELILGKKLLDPAFRRIISGKVKKTDLVKKGEGHRPSALFKYNPLS